MCLDCFSFVKDCLDGLEYAIVALISGAVSHTINDSIKRYCTVNCVASILQLVFGARLEVFKCTDCWSVNDHDCCIWSNPISLFVLICKLLHVVRNVSCRSHLEKLISLLLSDVTQLCSQERSLIMSYELPSLCSNKNQLKHKWRTSCCQPLRVVKWWLFDQGSIWVSFHYSRSWKSLSW